MPLTGNNFLNMSLWDLVVAMVTKQNSSYHNNPEYWDRQAWANSVDPDQTPQNAPSDQDLHYIPLIQHYFRHTNR